MLSIFAISKWWLNVKMPSYHNIFRSRAVLVDKMVSVNKATAQVTHNGYSASMYRSSKK